MILVVIAVLAVVFIVIAIVSSRNNNDTEQMSTCQDMIIKLRNGDGEGSYALLEPEAQSMISAEEWRTNAERYQRLFAGGTQNPWLIESSTTEPTEEGDVSATTVRYRFDSSAGEWDGVCQFYDNGSGLIASFSVTTPGIEP